MPTFCDVREYREHLKEQDRLHHLAWSEARRLRSTIIGPEEFVLAILHPEAGDSVAAQALRDCGIGREAFAELTMPKRSKKEIHGGPQLNPAAYRLEGLAEGIAAGLGATEVRAEHILLAFLWEPYFSHWVFDKLGSSRELVRARLAELGVDLPQSELPPPDPRRWGPTVQVSLDELWILLRELGYVLPEGAQICFNHDGEKGRIQAIEGVDLGVYLPRALARHRRHSAQPQDA
jgi:hypothetical protein